MDKDCSANLHCYGPQNMDDHLFFLFPKSEGSMLNGVSIDKISCYMAESGYHFISSQRLNAYVLACRKDVFSEISEKNHFLFEQNRYWRNRDLSCVPVCNSLQQTFETGTLSSDGLKTMVDSIVTHLSVTGLYKNEKCGDRLIKDIFSYIWEKRSTQLFIYEICEMFNIPRRTLEYNYKRFFKISPGQHIKYIKLDLVRQLLLSKKISPGDIIYTLEDLGIHHPGHFGQTYKAYFGESMSETLS